MNGTAATIAFDAAGDYVKGSDSDPCNDLGEHGVYATTATALWSLIVQGSSSSLPGCGPSQYTATWSAGCESFQIAMQAGDIDNCTGEGPFGVGAGVLTKRQ
jgi:hypothetical protein